MWVGWPSCNLANSVKALNGKIQYTDIKQTVQVSP